MAGRRGGKTLSAAWEVLFYALHPTQFHWDAHRAESRRPLWIWALARDHATGRPSLRTFQECIAQVGLVHGRDFRFNRTEKIFEFYSDNGDLLSTVEFRSADDPQRLRGAGLDILWVDEAAFIKTSEAWSVVRPGLSDKLGLLITTTTPKGKNWFWEEFWSSKALKDEFQFRVEYTSIDNPYFPRIEWEYAREHMHPIMFKQEYMAAFDALVGIALQGDWLQFYVMGDDPEDGEVCLPRKDGKLQLKTYMAVDPAISLSNTADYFAMALIGVAHDNSMGFLLDYYVDRIPFPDQLDKIREWHLKYRPMYIGIESNAYQAALSQMANRMEGLPPILPVISRQKKEERILAMGPLFKIGKIRIAQRHAEFIDQWVSYDPEMKSQKDDLLDAVEIALSTAGVLLPLLSHFEAPKEPSVDEEARWMIQQLAGKSVKTDPHLGSEF